MSFTPVMRRKEVMNPHYEHDTNEDATDSSIHVELESVTDRLVSRRKRSREGVRTVAGYMVCIVFIGAVSGLAQAGTAIANGLSLGSAAGLLWQAIVLSVATTFLSGMVIMRWLLPGKLAAVAIVTSDPSTIDNLDWDLQAQLIPVGGLFCSAIGAAISTSADGVGPAIAVAGNLGAGVGLLIALIVMTWCQKHRRRRRRHLLLAQAIPRTHGVNSPDRGRSG